MRIWKKCNNLLEMLTKHIQDKASCCSGLPAKKTPAWLWMSFRRLSTCLCKPHSSTLGALRHSPCTSLGARCLHCHFFHIAPSDPDSNIRMFTRQCDQIYLHMGFSEETCLRGDMRETYKIMQGMQRVDRGIFIVWAVSVFLGTMAGAFWTNCSFRPSSKIAPCRLLQQSKGDVTTAWSTEIRSEHDSKVVHQMKLGKDLSGQNSGMAADPGGPPILCACSFTGLISLPEQVTTLVPHHSFLHLSYPNIISLYQLPSSLHIPMEAGENEKMPSVNQLQKPWMIPVVSFSY